MELSTSHPSILIRGLCAAYAALAASAAFAAGTAPTVSNVVMSQAADRTVTITYDLADGPAVITLDIETNVVGTAEWVSIGGENISGGPVEKGQPTGDVWKKVDAARGTIIWHPDATWFGHKVAAGGIRAKVTAWALDDTPDYMVVDLAQGASQRQTYYEGESFLPGGVTTNNPVYWTSSIVMRKIKAKGVTWKMGSSSASETQRQSNETLHEVTLTNNYYIGIFPVTIGQWKEVGGPPAPGQSAGVVTWFSGAAANRLRTVEHVSYNTARRGASYNTTESLPTWPEPPAAGSFLGKLRERTGGIDFDLPSEAQWEYACRAGCGSGYWGDGSQVLNVDTDGNLGNLGRYKMSTTVYYYTRPEEGGPAIPGLLKPNNWGLYDMHGNVWEWCLDLYQPDISGNDENGDYYNGRVNIKDATHALDGTEVTTAVMKGGCYSDNAGNCRSARRIGCKINSVSNTLVNGYDYSTGCRVVCRAGLK